VFGTSINGEYVMSDIGDNEMISYGGFGGTARTTIFPNIQSPSIPWEYRESTTLLIFPLGGAKTSNSLDSDIIIRRDSYNNIFSEINVVV